MSTNRHVYLGAYIEVRLKQITRTVGRRRCPGGEDHVTSGPFCSECGGEIESYTEDQQTYPSFYDVEDDFDMVDTFVEFDGVGEDRDVVLAYANRNGDFNLGMGGVRLQRLRPEQIPAMIEAFNQAYGEDLTKLRGHDSVVSVEVFFGCVSHYM